MNTLYKTWVWIGLDGFVCFFLSMQVGAGLSS